MEAVRVLVLCSVVVCVTCQFPGNQANPRFCLELLRNQDNDRTTKALLGCVKRVKSDVQQRGRQFQLRQHYSSVGRCIAEDAGLVDGSGNVNQADLEQRIRRSRRISEAQRTYYLGLVPTCYTWDGCLKTNCKI